MEGSVLRKQRGGGDGSGGAHAGDIFGLGKSPEEGCGWVPIPERGEVQVVYEAGGDETG